MGASAMSLVYGAPGSTANAAGSETYKQLAIFGDIFERVRAQYVTPPDEKTLVENAINGMLTSLDPHSSYLNPEAAKDMRVQTKGEFGGLGIEVTMENELVKVITPIDDTPAAKAGVLRRRLHLGRSTATEVRGLTLNDAVEKMRGLVNTPIKLTILREGADKPIDITIVRDIIKVKAVKYRVENDVGYMKITSFTEKTYRRPRRGDRQDQEAGPGRQAEGLRARPAPQSGRPARPGGQRLRHLPRPRRDRLDARPRSRRTSPASTPAPATTSTASR